MIRVQKFIIAALFFTIVLLVANSAMALNPPEPQSGGRFFYAKGTKSSVDYRENMRPVARTFDNYQYGNGLKWRNIKLKPSVGYIGEYDSNIFLEDDDTDDDYINRLLWSVDLDVPYAGGKHLLTGGVQGLSEWFVDHNEANHTDFTYQLGNELNFNSFSLSVYDDFKDTQERSGQDLTDRIQRYENFLTGLLTVPFGEFFSETEATHYWINFGEGQFDIFDRNEFSVYPRLGVNAGPRTQVLAEYGYTHISYDDLDARDGNVHQASGGIRGFLGKSDFLAYQLWGGWQFRSYDDGSLDDFNNFVGRGELSYKPSKLTNIELRALRKPVESVTEGRSFYVRDEVRLRARRQVAEKLFVNINGTVGLNEYDEEDRLDFLWEPGAGLEYVLPGNILALFGEYKFGGRESDGANRDYHRHLATFGVKAEV